MRYAQQNSKIKKSRYCHFSQDERLELAILLKKGYSLREIGYALERSPSSVSREISKNSVKGQYDPRKAKHKARVRRKHSKYQGMKIREHPELESYIHEKMKCFWSPEEIAGRLKREKRFSITAKTIYKYLRTSFGEQLCEYLKYKQKYRKPRKDQSKWGEIIKDRVFINERPSVINSRKRYGDFEGDTMGYPKGYKETLAVIRERKSRYLLARKIAQQKYAMDAYKKLTCHIPAQSMTFDNGPENTRYKELGISTYFCHPFSSWEKGSVENGIGRIREFIPKKANVANYSDHDIRVIIDRINNTPCKCLDYQTPREVFQEQFLSRKKGCFS